MPRIDPLQLLECLQVLLTPNGGILSKNEVQRLAGLMTKFSKKLVSKCIYVLILKNTEPTLLDAFMDAGGWTLVQMWLNDAKGSQNWPLVTELLELLLVTPVDVTRLKSYNIPKMVKILSKRDDLTKIQTLSNQLVQQWLKIVKDETQNDSLNQKTLQVATIIPTVIVKDDVLETPAPIISHQTEETSRLVEQVPSAISTNTFYNNTSAEVNEAAEEKSHEEPIILKIVKGGETKDTKLDKRKSSHHDRSKHKSSSSKSSSKDKDRSNSSHKSKDKHSSNSNSNKSSKDRDKKDKDRHKSNGSVKSSSSHKSSSSNINKHKDKKESKEKQAEKDKDTLVKIQPQSLDKLPKIPKKSVDDKSKEPRVEEVRKGSISIEVRKTEDRPKTVKVYKSKMRLTGLEEEAKPAPPRPVKKPPSVQPVIPPPLAASPSLKRASPVKELSGLLPPEKKPKIELPLERPGSIKLIPPKPKPSLLLESDMFMDALTASATTKKEPKKRKRRTSVSKEASGNTSPPSSPAVNNNATSPIIKNITPPKFYQDTLETGSEDAIPEGEKSRDDEDMDVTLESNDGRTTPVDTSSPPTNEEEIVVNTDSESRVKTVNGLKGVLVHTKRKGPKKSIQWKPDEELVNIQYFELDETERVNVAKPFTDMAKQDLRCEREALQMSRKLPNEDLMGTNTDWKIPMEIDISEPLATPGSKSLEKSIQFAREKNILPVLYYNKRMIPDSPSEPDPENYQMKDPVIIPIDDPENPDHDFRNTPWPDPKGSPPPVATNNVPMFPNIHPQVPFQNFGVAPGNPSFNNMNMPQNVPPFGNPSQFVPNNMMGGGGGGGEWNNMPNPNQMMHPNMMNPDMMNHQQQQGGPNMNHNMFNMHQGPDNFNPMMNDGGNMRFPPPFQQGGGGPGMFPHNNFNMNRGGGGGFRRGGGNGPWLRMNGPPPGGWNNMRGGGPHRGGGRMCNHFRNKGFCRNGDNCPFLHANK